LQETEKKSIGLARTSLVTTKS